MDELRSRSEATEAVSDAAKAGNGGYIVLDLPDDQKAMFQDVLKGFEEFAKLKGYSISFSVDGSVADKIAFKFTILDRGITVSTGTVQADLKEYLLRVKRGDDLDDLPVIVPDAEHAALILAMKNRISFLQHTYSIQKNAIEFYERILKNADGRTMGVVPAPTFYIQGGGNMSPSNYSSIGSNNVAQGKNIEASNNIVDQSIRIADSYNEKTQQIENLDKLIAALTQAAPNESSKRAIVNLEKVKDELATETAPDGSRMKKWLETAKDSIKALALGKEVVDVATKTFDSFSLPF